MFFLFPRDEMQGHVTLSEPNRDLWWQQATGERALLEGMLEKMASGIHLDLCVSFSPAITINSDEPRHSEEPCQGSHAVDSFWTFHVTPVTTSKEPKAGPPRVWTHTGNHSQPVRTSKMFLA